MSSSATIGLFYRDPGERCRWLHDDSRVGGFLRCAPLNNNICPNCDDDLWLGNTTLRAVAVGGGDNFGVTGTLLWFTDRSGPSVSQSVISRSRPALTPPPARSPAPPLPVGHKYRVLAPGPCPPSELSSALSLTPVGGHTYIRERRRAAGRAASQRARRVAPLRQRGGGNACPCA